MRCGKIVDMEELKKHLSAEEELEEEIESTKFLGVVSIGGSGIQVMAKAVGGKISGFISNILKKITNSIIGSSKTEVKITEEIIEGAGKAETAIQTYWPPNRGFWGAPKTEILQPGTMIDRYGLPKGSFASPKGTPFEMRALPAENAKMPYNVYEVVEPVEVNSGKTAPWFGQTGLGTQYEFPTSIQQLLKDGILREVK